MGNIFKTIGLSKNNIFYSDLEIEENLITFITGASGAGKSTLLRLLNTTVSPDSGTILYGGNDIAALDTIILRREVSLVSQQVFLFDKTIEENFQEFYSYLDLPAPGREIAEKFLSLCCIDFPLDTDCTTMSGGEKQRVYIAVFLSLMPKVLLLDEPTSALDSQSSNAVFSNIFTFCKENKITVITVSHDLTLADSFADAKIEIAEVQTDAKFEIAGGQKNV